MTSKAPQKMPEGLERPKAPAAPQSGIPKTLTREQQPDISQLVEALVACAKASSAAEVGLIVDAALAAYRKGGDHV